MENKTEKTFKEWEDYSPHFFISKYGPPWRACFKIGVQTFNVCERDDKAEAQWFLGCLKTAFDNFEKFSLYKDHPTTASGSVAAAKEEEDEEPITDLHPDYVKEEVAKLMVYKIQAYEQLAELASLRQQLKEREEALKELLPMAQWGYDLLVPFDKKGMGREWPAIIERARKLLNP